MKKETIAIIGAGNMGVSLLQGLLADGTPPQQIWLADPDARRLTQLEQQFHVHVTDNNEVAIKSASVVILAVKPQIIANVAQQLSASIQLHRPLVLSVAAGVREDNLKQWLGEGVAIVRCMPNTPALIRCGAAALHANQSVSPKQRDLAETILRAVGIVVWLADENQMDAVTALSGSGPAYFFLLLEILQQVGEKLGLSADTAKLLSLQTALGAAKMALETSDSVGALRHKVTSPGGTTEAAIRVLEDGNIRELFTSALQAATKRSTELSQS